jgi:tetratricopeptide (TPR) repeat protein
LEFHRQLNRGEATWLEGHAMSFGQAMAFHPLIDLLKRTFHIEEDDVEGLIIEKIEQSVLRLGEELRPILPYLRHMLAVDPGDSAVQTMDPQLRRAELFEALRRLMVRAFEVRPQVLLFEDLHWMDQATEAFLLMIADSIPTSRVLCLFTYRPGYVHPFGERIYHTRIPLSTLSTSDSVRMAQAILATEQLPETLQRLISDKAEGNPFFVEEVVKSLQEIKAIRRVGAQYVLTNSIHLYASLGEFWLARGDPDKAQGFTDQCLEIAMRTNSQKYVVKGWRLQGEIDLAQRQWEEAEGWLRQALSLAQAVGNPTQIWKTHVAMGRLHAAVQQPEKAQQAYQAARDVIERIKMRLSHPELRASLEGSPLVQDIYELSMPD